MCNLVYSVCSKGVHASSLAKVHKRNIIEGLRGRGRGGSFPFSALATISAHNLIGDACYAGCLVCDLVRKCFLTCCQFFYYYYLC